MSTVAEPKQYTPEDLLRMPDGNLYELVEGQLVERTMSKLSSYVAGKIYSRLDAHCVAHQLGWVFPEGTTYQCFPGAPEKVRKADTSFIGRDRMSVEEFLEEGHTTIAPDLAVEVLSPNDLVYEVDAKVKEYLGAGTRLVWLVNPEARTVTVRRRQGIGTVLDENDELDGEDVIPGFRCRVGDLFLLPPGVGPNA
jgi:Uma2 family endonuclease